MSDFMNYWPWWSEDLAAESAPPPWPPRPSRQAEVAPPGGGWDEILPRPRGGSFLPDPDGPKSPGYSCAHCGALCGRRHPRGRVIHCWNRSVFCNWRRLDFRLAKLYQAT